MEQQKKVNFRFPGVKIFSPSSQPGETTYGKFIEQKGPLFFFGCTGSPLWCAGFLYLQCLEASLAVEHRLESVGAVVVVHGLSCPEKTLESPLGRKEI